MTTFTPNSCCRTISEAWSCEGCCPDRAKYEAAWKRWYPDSSDEALRREIDANMAKYGLKWEPRT